MKPNSVEKLEILKLEMGLLQGTFEKYDDIIFSSRGWFITVWLGAMGVAFTIEVADLALLASVASVVYWLFEGLMRHQYWYKYVVRYRAIRDWLNIPNTSETISIYDLTNHYGRSADPWERFRKSFFKPEPTVMYSVMCIAAFLARSLVP